MASNLSLGTKISYASGQIAVNAKDTLFHYYFLFFFNTVMGVPATIVSAAKFIALIVDAITDPLMGGISDNWRSKIYGRRHLFMLISAVPLGFGMWMLFDPPAHYTISQLTIWMIGFAIFVRVSLTLFYVPFVSLNADLTESYEERTTLSTLRVLFGNSAEIIMGMVILLVFLANTPEFPDGRLNPAGYAKMGILGGVIAIASVLIAFGGTRNQIPRLNKSAEGANNVVWWKAFSEIARAFALKSFRGLSLGFTLFSIMAGVATAMTIYMATFYWSLPQGQLVVVLFAIGIAVIPGAIIAPIMTGAFDKKIAIIVSTFLFAALYTAPVFGRVFGILPGNEDPSIFLIVVGFSFASQIFAICIKIISESMMADVASEYEMHTGNRQEGVLFSAISFARKASFGVGGVIAGIGLDIIKFPTQTLPSDVAQQTIYNLGVFVGPTIFILCLIAIVFFLDYPITRKTHQETMVAVNARREGAVL